MLKVKENLATFKNLHTKPMSPPPPPPTKGIFIGDLAAEHRFFMLHQEHFNNIINCVVRMCVQTSSIMFGNEKGDIMQKEAFAKFGNKQVKKWHKAGLLHPQRKNGCIYYPLIELYMAVQRELITKITPCACGEIENFTLKLSKM